MIEWKITGNLERPIRVGALNGEVVFRMRYRFVHDGALCKREQVRPSVRTDRKAIPCNAAHNAAGALSTHALPQNKSSR
ncbi:hypothetical protein [Rhodanobacter sp. BL-MT-08]